jgi:hypothetical protein
MTYPQIIKPIFKTLIYIFAGIGFFLTAGFFAVKFGFTNTDGIIDTQRADFLKDQTTQTLETKALWNQGEEWLTFKNAITKDLTILKRVEGETGVSSRLIVSMIAVEQLRLFYSEREVFKQVFAPLKLLGNQTQFSWGIAGIKEETAKQIETHLKDKTSSYYLGETYETYLDFKTNNTDQERFERITDSRNRYFAYLYTALYLKQFITSWQKAGFDIAEKPEILATLYNIGFANSKPNADPKVGGAEIEINNTPYSFGRLGGEIYNSNELLEYFPR